MDVYSAWTTIYSKISIYIIIEWVHQLHNTVHIAFQTSFTGLSIYSQYYLTQLLYCIKLIWKSSTANYVFSVHRIIMTVNYFINLQINVGQEYYVGECLLAQA